MKQGLTMPDFAAELKRQNESKRDFVVDTSEVHILSDISEGQPYFFFNFSVPKPAGKGKAKEYYYEMNRYTLQQIANHTNIPMRLVDLMAQSSEREIETLCELFTVRLQENPAKRMLRTMENLSGEEYARAFLSDRYRRLDNYDLSGPVLEAMAEFQEDLQIVSADITDEKMYLKAINKDMQFEIGDTTDRKGRSVGDVIEAGIVVSNSEVGQSSLRVEPFIHRLVCLNGMISNDYSLRKTHIGSNLGYEINAELMSDETEMLEDAALFSKVSDVVRSALLNEDKFLTIAQSMFDAKDRLFDGVRPTHVVQELGKKYTLTQDTTESILEHLMSIGELSQFGLANAVTAYARDDEGVMTYDDATGFEELGGKIIELGPSEWRTITNNAKRLAKQNKN